MVFAWFYVGFLGNLESDDWNDFHNKESLGHRDVIYHGLPRLPQLTIMMSIGLNFYQIK